MKKEDIAKLVYTAMQWAVRNAENGRHKPDWQEGGNSFAQDQARATAANILESSLIGQALQNAAEILADFKGEPDASKLEQWQACYAMLFKQMNELVQSKIFVIRLTEKGLDRVLEGKVGMTFILDKFCGVENRCAAVRDYRYPGDNLPYQIWVIGEGGYEVL